jgi:hypothetical protein
MCPPQNIKAMHVNVIPAKMREWANRFSESRMGYLLRTAMFTLLFINLLYADPVKPGVAEWLSFLNITLSRILMLIFVGENAYRAGRCL